MDPQSLLATWKGWLSQPFDEKLSIVDWLLITILAATVAYLWTAVLRNHLQVERLVGVVE
jgi:hypothetical protein